MNNAENRRHAPLLTACILSLVLLSGCAGDGATPPETTVAVQPQPAPATPETAALPAPARTPEPKIDAPLPDEVLGWSTDELSKTLGAASLVRRDMGAEVWQYRTDDCVLLLFLYPKASSGEGPLQVDHLHVGNGGSAGKCLESIVRARLQRSS